MKAIYNSQIRKPAKTKLVLLTAVILVGLNFPFTKGTCVKVSLEEETNYDATTKELISSSLSECGKQAVWMDGIELQSAPIICDFYKSNNFTPIWTEGCKLTNQAEDVMQLLKNSYKYGFETSYFDIEELQNYVLLLEQEESIKKRVSYRISFEFLLTNSVFTFMSYINKGAEYSSSKNFFTDTNSPALGFPSYLNAIVHSPEITANILRLQPKVPEYQSLQNELENIVENFVDKNNTVSIPNPDEDIDSSMKKFALIFSKEGVLQEDVDIANPEIFNSLLIEFQKTLGIKATGKVDSATRRATSNLIQNRYSKIASDLEKIRKHNTSGIDS